MKFTFKTKLILFFVAYLIFRLAIFNVNSAEWGDSYRILRATNSLENFTYPKDEKRPPLYSAFLILIPKNFDPVEGGRLLMVIVSVITVFLFLKLLDFLSINFTDNQKIFAIFLLAYNPLFVYWSMRIYADSFFLMLSLLAFTLYYSFNKDNKYFKLIFLSIICFLGIMTRFEGYLLISALFLTFIFNFFKKRDVRILINLSIFLIIGFSLFFFAVNTPWTFFKNPISSSYVDEANRRLVGIYDILGFLLHLIFILGSFFSFYFIFFDKKKLIDFIKNYFLLFSFLIIELMLAVIWPAAIPRLLIQVIPILIILYILGLESFEEREKTPYFFVFPLTIVVYLVGQLLIKSQFLLTNYYFMLSLIIVSLLQTFFIYKRNLIYYKYSVVLSVILWMSFFVYLHKDIYKVLNIGVTFFSKEYKKDGVIVSNDVSYLTKFYFGDNLKYVRQIDFGIDIEKHLRDRNAKYLIVTNEHNPDMKFTVSKYSFLENIFEYREEINGREFFIVISKVNLK